MLFRSYENGGLGIDLGGDDVVTLNDSPDADGWQNFPVLTAATTSAGTITISGTLQSAPNTNFRLEFFASSAIDPSGYGEGERFLGTVDVTTDASGTWNFSPTFTVGVAVGDFVTATATNLTTDDTSEFAASVPATTNTQIGRAHV